MVLQVVRGGQSERIDPIVIVSRLVHTEFDCSPIRLFRLGLLAKSGIRPTQVSVQLCILGIRAQRCLKLNQGGIRPLVLQIRAPQGDAQIANTGRKGRSYNVGGNEERNNLEVVHTVCSILDELRPATDGRPHAQLVEHVADRPGHDHRYAIDASRIRDELGWEPLENFESGMRKTVEWYLAHQDWVTAVLEGSYDGGRLGTATGKAS